MRADRNMLVKWEKNNKPPSPPRAASKVIRKPVKKGKAKIKK
jgi:hypothetical protein